MCVHELPQLCYNFTRACSRPPQLHYKSVQHLSKINKYHDIEYIYVEKISFSCCKKIKFPFIHMWRAQYIKMSRVDLKIIVDNFHRSEGGKLDHLSHTLVNCVKSERKIVLK